MFLNKIQNWQKADQILGQMVSLDQITSYQHYLFRKYALGNAVDEDLNPLDITDIKYGYLCSKVKIYKDPDLGSQLETLFFNMFQPQRQRIHHRLACTIFSSCDPDLCICPQLDQISPYPPVPNAKIDIRAPLQNIQNQNNQIDLQSLVDNPAFRALTTQSLREKWLGDQIGLKTTINPGQTTIIDYVALECSNLNKFTQLTLDQYKMLGLIYQAYKDDEARDTITPNLYLLDSPTGTGKTETFILSQFLTKYLYRGSWSNEGSLVQRVKGLSTLIFSNNELVASQSLNRFAKYLNYSKSPCHRIEIVLKGRFPVLYMTSTPNGKDIVYDLVLSFSPNRNAVQLTPEELSKSLYLYALEPQYKYAYICNTRYQYAFTLKGIRYNPDVIDTPVEIDISNFLRERTDILICALYNYQFLNMFGILNPEQNIQTVVYDELDVFYQKDQIETFHKFFFSQLYNFTAKTIIFASATLQVDFIDKIDYNFSNVSQTMIQRQLFEKVSSSSLLEKFPVVLSNGAKLTCTSIQGFKSIIEKSWQAGNTYFYFDLEVASNIYASYAVIKNGALTIKTPNHMSKIKGSIKSLEETLISKLLPFKHIFVTNRLLRNNHFFTEKPVLRKLHSNISVLKNIPLLRTVNLNLITTNLDTDPSGRSLSLNIQTYLDPHIQAATNNERVLIVTVNDKFTRQMLLNMQKRSNKIKALTAEGSQISVDLYNYIEALNYFKLKLQTPFSQQLLSNLKETRVNTADQSGQIYPVLYDDFNNIGRGIDIEGLKKVILLLPLHYQMEQAGFTRSEFIQILGRVGRFRKVGRVEIGFIDIQYQFKQNDTLGAEVKEYIENGLKMRIEDIQAQTFKSLQIENHANAITWLGMASADNLSIANISHILQSINP